MSLADETSGDIGALHVGGDIVDTPGGRMMALDSDTRAAYENIHVFVLAGLGGRDRGEWEEELHDLWDVLIDIGQRTFDSFVGAPVGLSVPLGVSDRSLGRGVVSGLQRLRYPPDGDVERWVREGPPGHVNYEGGPVYWETSLALGAGDVQ